MFRCNECSYKRAKKRTAHCQNISFVTNKMYFRSLFAKAMLHPGKSGRFVLIIAITFFACYCHAQLKADFTADQSTGCSPLAVHFTNTTSGASSKAVFSWDLGNGNTSSLKDAAGVFRDAATYVVTLTVTDTNKTVTVSHSITVYSPPSVAFSASLQKGCSPLTVSFTGNGSAANGTIANYYWDFGDGNVQSAGNGQVSHVYSTAAQESVGLTVTDSHGCQSTLLKSNIINVLPGLVSAFSPEKKVLCRITDPANFINTSTGPGTLSYQWDFGDGATSTLVQPSHVYSKPGTYPVTLTVNSSEGCTVTSTQQDAVNAANFKSDVAIVTPVCENPAYNYNNKTVFHNTSTPVADTTLWEFTDGSSFLTSGSDTVYRYFQSAGNYSLKLTNTFGSCTDAITVPVIVNKSPVINGFLVDTTDICGSPATVNFKDTTSSAVQWQWSAYYYTNLDATTPSASYTFTNDGTYYVTDMVTNAAGCNAWATKQLDIYRPKVNIRTAEDHYNNNFLSSCGPLTVHFSAVTSDSITSYKWDFGDGTTSTVDTPAHLYSNAGTYYPRLTYVTAKGCTGITDPYYPISIEYRINTDFVASATNICGNTPVEIHNVNAFAQYYSFWWDYGDGTINVTSDSNGGNYYHQYMDSGTFTLTMVASDGTCTDTIVKKDYIKVSPPFPKINSHSNTCDGTRGEVTFNQSTTQAISGVWDFGDGTTAPYADQPQLKHMYTKTGFYKVVLTTTNGACTVGDSIYISVLLKQHPILTADKTSACSMNDLVQLTYSNLETNPSPYGNAQYGYGGWYHADGSYALAGFGVAGGGDLSQIPYTMSVYNFSPGSGLYSMVTSANFGCVDTTNTIPLTVKGPLPGFRQIFDNPCSNTSTVTLEDTSRSRLGSALVSWTWDFGDGTSATYTHGGKITHTYSYQGYNQYTVILTVTDAGGCQAVYYGSASTSANRLQASFYPSATVISPGTTVNFSNATQTSDPDHTSYQWFFGDGTQATSTDASKTFATPGTFIIKLIATNTLTGCKDTAFATITVKYVNAAFAFNSSFISNSKCPPVAVSFTNTSSNVVSITWDFGDGSGATDVFNPTHVYTKAGKYWITVTTKSDNGTVYTTKDSVFIDEPAVNISANILHSCTAQSITFSAKAHDAVSYLWDFGDGNVYQTTDTFAVHNYPAAGIYMPDIIATDSNGCTTSINKADTIVIDSLNVSLPGVPSKICVPKQLTFDPQVVSISGDQSPQSLAYHWTFGTGNPNDTANQRSPSFLYQQPGSYTVRLTVRSAYGCVQQVTKTILASQGLAPYITGPSEICQQATATFKGNIQLPGQPAWLWLFDDGSTVSQQNPPPKEYDQAGNFPVKLVVNNNGCIDTVTQMLQVDALPAASVTPHEFNLCQGSSVTLTAAGGASYSWSPGTGLNNLSAALVVASPAINTIYVVTVTDVKGCKNKDSANVTVIHPFAMQVTDAVSLCMGQSVTLNVSGPNTYQWINNTTGLSSVSIGNPVASPAGTTTYTVTGTDLYKCFTDTAGIIVTVSPLPVVDAGPPAVILAGSSYQLQPAYSADVIKWNWSPPGYLSCADCAAPLAKPAQSELYTLTVANQAGCVASDTVSVKLFCSESRIFIPTAFSPNGDGVNETFSILGDGISSIHYFRIYDRWGTLVFEHSNYRVGDRNGSWDGRYKGLPVPQGSYVYFAELSCGNETYVQKGSVTVLY